MESNLILPPLFGIFGLAVAFILYLLVMRYDGGTDKVKKIGDQIHLGAMVFMRREYTYLAMFVAVLIVLSYLFLGLNTALAVTAGALSSSLAGWLGMFSAIKQMLELQLRHLSLERKQPFLWLFMVDQLWGYVLLLLDW